MDSIAFVVQFDATRLRVELQERDDLHLRASMIWIDDLLKTTA
ncbi:hypothetical protein ABZV60_34905 [Streptomyces sp. NPDC004787]